MARRKNHTTERNKRERLCPLSLNQGNTKNRINITSHLMGACLSTGTPEELAAMKASREIEKMMNQQFEIDNSKVKLLLLGGVVESEP
jgi:hypothetical protein